MKNCCPVTSFFKSDNQCNNDNSCGGKKSCKSKFLCGLMTILFVVLVAGVLDYFLTPYLVHKTIKKDPKFIIQAIEEMYKNEKEKSQQDAMAKIPAITQVAKNNSNLPYLGNKNGTDLVFEFFDYNCGVCKKQAEELNKAIANNKNLKVILLDFPILSQSSLITAQVAIHVFMQEPAKFDKFYHAAVQYDKPLDKVSITKIVTGLGMSKDTVQKAVENKVVRDIIESNYSFAKDLALQGTPSLIINGRLVPHYMQSSDILKALTTGNTTTTAKNVATGDNH